MKQQIITKVTGILTLLIVCYGGFVKAQLGAPPEITAPESIPKLDVSPTGKIMIMKGTIEGKQMAIKETEVIQGYPPNQFFEDQDFQVELLDPQKKVIKTVGFKDPRVVRVIDGEGAVYIREKADFSIAVPYAIGSTNLRILPLKQTYMPSPDLIKRGVRPEQLKLPAEQIVQLEIKPLFQKFCIDKSGDADCDFLIRGKLPTIKPINQLNR